MNVLSLLFTILALVLVLVLAWLVIKGLSLYSNRNMGKSKIAILEVRQMAGREKLVLISYQGHDYLLGVTQASVSVIDKSASSIGNTSATENPVNKS